MDDLKEKLSKNKYLNNYLRRVYGDCDMSLKVVKGSIGYIKRNGSNLHRESSQSENNILTKYGTINEEIGMNSAISSNVIGTSSESIKQNNVTDIVHARSAGNLEKSPSRLHLRKGEPNFKDDIKKGAEVNNNRDVPNVYGEETLKIITEDGSTVCIVNNTIRNHFVKDTNDDCSETITTTINYQLNFVDVNENDLKEFDTKHSQIDQSQLSESFKNEYSKAIESSVEKVLTNLNGFPKASRCPVSRLRLRNIENGEIQDDYLNGKHEHGISQCTENACLGSIMGVPGRGDLPREPAEVLKHAKDFLDQYFSSSKRLGSSFHETRWKEVQAEIAAKGTYNLKETELVFGAKLAWRNAPRCIGRIQWSKLQVFDCREVKTTSQMFDALCNHIKYSTNKGNIRSAITIFPQRTDGKHDYRIWNNQLISYAGYKHSDGTILGDPMHIEFTELCMKLGWKPQKTAWDIMPLVLSANGKDPDFFEIPRDLVMEIQFTHPNYPWFEELQLRWYALPAVSNMRLDCGGIEFTANAFNGWYMQTEIACRNICDTNRLNMLEKVAIRMGLDTSTSVSLWKDRALVEINLAVLHSFQQRNVTIVDHHTASETFMKHLENESKLRSGCPSDWVWIVPPMSGSITPVFHQEMALYFLKPSYEYQDPASKTHIWQKGREGDRASVSKRPHRKFHFKQIARAVKFTSKLFGRALSRRIKATVLYATETGKSEQFAKQLGVIFGHAFNAQVHCMSEYDLSSIEHEALLLVVTSTFGNGDPPENGETFAHNLNEMKNNTEDDYDDTFSVTPKAFIRGNSQFDMMDSNFTRNDTLRGSSSDAVVEADFGPLSNVRFAVFALGSSAYPNFCEFGKNVDRLLGQLGGERLMKMETGDELCGQEQAFKKWTGEVFKVACETFCLDDDNTITDVADALGTLVLSTDNVRFSAAKNNTCAATIIETLQKAKNNASKKIFKCPVLQVTNLHGGYSARSTMFLEFKIEKEMNYQPGDHVGILPCNRKEMVEFLLSRLEGVSDADEPLLLEILKENHTHNGPEHTWEPHERLPICSLRDLFTRFVDITSPPSTSLLAYLATCCSDADEKAKLESLSTEATAYEDWRHLGTPTLEDALRQFKSAKPHAALLAARLNPLQPRFYSISSSPLAHPGVIQITVAVVTYKSQDGNTHYGVCSNYLKDMKPGDEAYMFIRSASGFHLPENPQIPIILVGPGTGIAPFRGFWHHRRMLAKKQPGVLGDAWLFFGCRTREVDLYAEEKQIMLKEGVLNKVFLALSREEGIPKTYVQGMAEQEGENIYNMLVKRKGHFYVCGDCTMAEHVYQTLKKIVQKHGDMSEKDAENVVLNMKNEERYHEDIFGITLRTAEIHNKSRESARNRMTSLS